MKKYSIYLILIALVGSLISCHDIIEEDISDKTIHIIIPTDGLSSTVYKQVFKWDEVGGALKYRIQIVTPNFESGLNLVTDTTVTGTQFSKTLDPGDYQWRIWAENGNYKTKEQTYDLEILEAPLNEQTVTLKSPVNNFYQKSLDFRLTWERVPGAESYLVEIDTASGNFSPALYSGVVTGGNITYYNQRFLTEGTYIWRVTARNAGDETPPSSPFTLGTYTSKPKPPTLLSPGNGVSVTSPVSFSWSAPTDGRGNTYTVYVYFSIAADTSTTEPRKYTVGEGKTSTSITFNPPNNSEIYWTVSTTDKAGNESGKPFPYRKLTTQ